MTAPRELLLQRLQAQRAELEHVQRTLDVLDLQYEQQKATYLEQADRLAAQIAQYEHALQLLLPAPVANEAAS